MKQVNKQYSLTITALRKGNKDAFETIYTQHVDKLTMYVNGFTKNQDQTDDIVQETFIKLWDNRKSLKPDMSIMGFLYTTAYHDFIDKYRKRKRELAMLDNWMHKQLMENIKDKGDSEKKIKEMLVAIEALPPKCKEIFVLSKFEGLKYAEISEKLKISVKTVEAQMGRAFALIRKRINDNKTFLLFLNVFSE